jgi:hypothetical protein
MIMFRYAPPAENGRSASLYPTLHARALLACGHEDDLLIAGLLHEAQELAIRIGLNSLLSRLGRLKPADAIVEVEPGTVGPGRAGGWAASQPAGWRPEN